MEAGNSIFKFFSFKGYALQNLKTLQLYCNHYSQFNDPFECWCIEKTGIPDPHSDWGRYDQIARTWGFSSGKQVEKEDLFEYCKEFDNEYAMRVWHYVESARISCFSLRPDNLLMWSHYADGLRGFCIEFDREELLIGNEFDANIYDVKYQVSPPVIDSMVYEVAKDQVWYHEMAIDEEHTKRKYLKDHVPDTLLPEYKKALIAARELLFDLYFKMLCYKPVDWKYEEEVRLIYHTENNTQTGEPFSFPGSSIKSIIIGEKASQSDIQDTITIVRNLQLDVPIMKVLRNQNGYLLNFERIDW